MSRPIMYEVVRTDAGWHGRIRAGNHQILWQTESYKRRRNVLRAIELVAGDWLESYTPLEVDERKATGGTWWITDGFFYRGGKKVAGPYLTLNAATKARSELEAAEGHHNYFIDEVGS